MTAKKKTHRLIIFVCTALCICLSLGSCSNNLLGSRQFGYKFDGKPSEIKGIWISFCDLDFANGNEAEFIKKFDKMMQNAKSVGFNSVFVHVRSHGDAYYKSKLFVWSKYITGTQGQDPGFDPLEIMIRLAHNHNLQFHAWINPFRVSSTYDISALSDKNQAKIWLKSRDKSVKNYVKRVNGGIYYNPSEKYIRDMVVDGVREIVENYAIDGVHMDDYFYPTTAKSFDMDEYAAYCAKHGDVSLTAFRRDNINEMVRNIYKTVKSENNKLIFGISPQANIYNNENLQYVDVEKWCQNDGYVDYIAPQIYFGFEYDYDNGHGQNMRFDKCADDWVRLVKNKNISLVFGLGLYRSGEPIEGSVGVYEWVNNDDVIKRQIEYVRGCGKYDGVIIYAYSSMFANDTAEREVENFKPLLNK